jgi:hypothetical protein
MRLAFRAFGVAILMGLVTIPACEDETGTSGPTSSSGSGGSGNEGGGGPSGSANGPTTSSMAASTGGGVTGGAGGTGGVGGSTGGAGGLTGGAGGSTNGVGGTGGAAVNCIDNGMCDVVGGEGCGCADCIGAVRCVPSSWDCNPGDYDETSQGVIMPYCDCSCGAHDPDCDTAANFLACGGIYRFGQTCVSDVCAAPPSWTACADSLYDEEGQGVAAPSCNCECGAEDPDCAPGDGFPVAGCGANETCHGGECDVPSGWNCMPLWYFDATCDCGCGILDPACADATLASCSDCDFFGSCSDQECVGNTQIDPFNNAICL